MTPKKARLYPVFLIVALGITLSLAIVYWMGMRVSRANVRLILCVTIIDDLQDTFSTLQDAETGQRGFLLTGEEEYLAPYEDALTGVNTDLDKLKHRAARGEMNRESVAKIVELTQLKMGELAQTVRLRREQGLAAALAVVRTDRGKRTMDAVRAEIQARVEALTAYRTRAEAQRDRDTWWRTAITALMAVMMLGFVSWAFSRIQQGLDLTHKFAVAAERERELLEVTLGSIGDAVIVTNAQGCVGFMNRVAEMLTGWSAVEAGGEQLSKVFRIINESTRATVESPVDKVLRLGTVVGLANHTILIARDGRETPIDDSGAPVRSPDGQIHGVVLVFRDFSQHRMNEKSLQDARVSAERAKAAAERASAAKDRFLAILSHELRTPLTPVLAGVSLLQKNKTLDADTRETLDVVRRNAELEARLIDDLLDLNRIARGKVTLQKQPVSIGTIIERAIEVCRPDIESKHLQLVVDSGLSDCVVNADPSRIMQVFWNVVMNAVRFTPDGGRIGIHCSSQDHAVRVEVSDTGIGLEPGTTSRIFEAFEQADPMVARQFGGLGLGLAISKTLVELHSGTIQAHSEGKGKGSTFVVTLPTVHGTAGSASGPAAGLVSPVAQATRQALKILIVEDHEDTAKLMQRVLRTDGHEVKWASSKMAALAAARGEAFDLIVSDVGLPDGSGLELYRELQAGGIDIPGIALSGYGQEQDIEQSRLAGFKEHVTKPVDLDRLLAVVARVGGRSEEGIGDRG